MGVEMKVAIGSDHAGFELKESVKKYLTAKGAQVEDCGAISSERVDYPDYAQKVAKLIQDGKADRGVLMCGSGIGMCMAANRFQGVRAAVLHDVYDAEMSRKHNDANVACFRSRELGSEISVTKLLDIFLSTEFEGGRHTNRVKKIDGGIS